MSITTAIQQSFNESFQLYQDLVQAIGEPDLNSRLGTLPSNTVGLQLWCVVGARESFSNAIRADGWTGFTCSLEQPTQKADVSAALNRSAAEVLEVLASIDSFSDTQNQLIINLLTHEAAHQGQLIRYLYGVPLPIPESWKKKYALD